MAHPDVGILAAIAELGVAPRPLGVEPGSGDECEGSDDSTAAPDVAEEPCSTLCFGISEVDACTQTEVGFNCWAEARQELERHLAESQLVVNTLTGELFAATARQASGSAAAEEVRQDLERQLGQRLGWRIGRRQGAAGHLGHRHVQGWCRCRRISCRRALR